MSTPEEAVRRDDAVPLPHIGWTHHGTGGVYAPVSNNQALPWCVMAAAFGFLGFGGMLAVALLKPWETEGRAVRAEMRAEFSDQLAAVRKDAGDAAAVSEIWRNRVNKLEAEVNANRR